jgi:hypothetical protein
MKRALCLPLRQVIVEIRKNPLNHNAFVFGSMARGQDNPKDLDLMILLPLHISPNQANHPNAHALFHLLTIARQQWYGYLDPFIWDGKRLWTRNAEATAYERSRLPYSVIQNDLLSFSQLFTLYDIEE